MLVSAYRYYCLKKSKIVSGDNLDADDDAAAVRAVQLLGKDADCEVWQGARLVAKISRNDTPNDREPSA